MTMTNEKNVNIGAEDFAVENTAQAVSKYAYTHKFSEPFNFEGTTYNELTFDWGNLTGKDFLKIEQEMTMSGIGLVSPEYSGPFMARMAVRACTEKITLDVIEAMALKDFNTIRGKAKSFLMR